MTEPWTDPEIVDSVIDFYQGLDDRSADAFDAAVERLTEQGPVLGRPTVDTLDIEKLLGRRQEPHSSRRFEMSTPIAGGRTRKWSEIRREVTPQRRARIDAIKKRMEASERLFEIRKELGMTQAELADRLGITQGNVSELERREDALLSSVRSYIEAMGGELELKARFGDQEFSIDLRDFASLTDEEAAVMNAGPTDEVIGEAPAGMATPR